MPLHVFQIVYQPRKLLKKKGKEEELGWFYFCPWRAYKPLVTDCPSSVKQWKESWFWVTGNWQRVVDDPEPKLDVPFVYGIANALPRCQLSSNDIEVLRSIYEATLSSRKYGFILNRHRCLTELAEMNRGMRPRPTMARLTSKKSKVLALGSSEDFKQKKVIEELSREENRKEVGATFVIEIDEAARTSEGEVSLTRKKKVGGSS
ncbi:Uncharacterized protein Adt_38372 [Abeliophyllum distichum]|uniref:Uncharacterized protein n=1 Tax=Abeliophyllum distichum TaxID=126358 RepID=A0ABD1Q247_9LAMI